MRTAVVVAACLLASGAKGGASDGALCPPLPPPSGRVVDVATVPALVSAVDNALPGDTIRIADGTYHLAGAYLWVDTAGVTLRSASGDRDAVVLDGDYVTTEIVVIAASDVTVADLTLREAYYHPVHVVPGDASDTLNTLIYNVHIIDPGQQAIKINPSSVSGPYFTDDGTVACSTVELTAAGRAQVLAINGSCYTGGVDAHAARGWTIRDNLVAGFWCTSGLSEHGIHLWRGARDTVVERNLLANDARGIGFGLVDSGTARTYPDDPCPGAGYVDHYGGVIRNNFVFAGDAGLLTSADGFDCGICLASACDARVLHNTVASTQAPAASSVEWRFESTDAEISNNLATHNFWQRDGASATLAGNLAAQPLSLFVDGAGGDLHLDELAAAAIDQVAAPAGVSDDIDGDARPLGAASDIGADELRPGEPIFAGGFESGNTGEWSDTRGGHAAVTTAAAYLGSYGLEVGLGSCTDEQVVVVDPQTVAGIVTVAACESIIAADVVVAAGGELDCTAGYAVVLAAGFTVEPGGAFTAAVDPSLDPYTWVEDSSPSAETTYNLELHADFDDLAVGAGDELVHLAALAADGTVQLRLLVRSGPTLVLQVRDDTGTFHATDPLAAAAGWNRIAVSWESAADATASLTVGVGPPALLTGLDTSVGRIDRVRWGIVGGELTGSSGGIAMDGFSSWR